MMSNEANVLPKFMVSKYDLLQGYGVPMMPVQLC